jgi:prepilin-type N-terminal cleavage/methylation domain-containing protein
MLKHKGFTLVEFLLYIAIVSVVLTVAGSTILNILFGKAKLSALHEVGQNARSSLGRMTNAVAGSSGTVSPLPQATSSALALSVSDVSKNPTVFSVSGGVLYIQEGAASSSRLTDPEVFVDSLEFGNVSFVNAPSAIKIRMKIRTANSGGRPENNFEQVFYATSNTRKN